MRNGIQQNKKYSHGDYAKFAMGIQIENFTSTKATRTLSCSMDDKITQPKA